MAKIGFNYREIKRKKIKKNLKKIINTILRARF
jgi:hypothetical protein